MRRDAATTEVSRGAAFDHAGGMATPSWHELSPTVWTLEYAFAGEAFSTTFACKLADGSVAVTSPATNVDRSVLDALSKLGPVSAIVAPNGFHHLGVAQWREAFPAATVYASKETAARVAKKNPKAGAFEDLALLVPKTGPDVGFVVVPDTKAGETWVWAKVDGGYAWFVSDTLANIPRLPPNPFVKLLFWMTKSAPGFRVFHLALGFLVKDKKATLRRFAEALAERPPVVIVPAHGPAIDGPDAAERTRAVVAAAVG